eukprot:gene20570-21237_t
MNTLPDVLGRPSERSVAVRLDGLLRSMSEAAGFRTTPAAKPGYRRLQEKFGRCGGRQLRRDNGRHRVRRAFHTLLSAAFPAVSGAAGVLAAGPSPQPMIAARWAFQSRPRRASIAAMLGCFMTAAVGATALAEPRPAIAMHGEPLYPPGFDHFAYANPDAPKRGTLTLGVDGSFDSLNPFIIKGNKASGLRGGIDEDNVYESLMVRGYDEPFTLYALVAESVDLAADRSRVTFQIDPRAHFSDGVPITPDDVVFSFGLLREKAYFYKNYQDVASAAKVGERGVEFIFKDATNRELPLILGLMPILPKHKTDADAFDKTTLEPPIASGPYVVAAVDPGHRVVLKRDPNYWGKDLAVRRGLYNFDEIRYDYYRDKTNLFEAFTSGLPKSMSGIAMNTRRPQFADRRVREALVRLYDFEWANKNIYFGLYARTGSFFHGSDLASPGHPANVAELKLLAPFPGEVAQPFLDGTWTPPATDGSGRDRTQLKEALTLLTGAGYKFEGGQLRNAATGAPFVFEILTRTREQERVALGYQKTLKAIGIDATVRNVDSSEYERRRSTFDFDMTIWNWYASLSPGNEQFNRWSS